MKNIERAIMIIKHEGIQRGLVGEILARIEKKGLKIIAMKMKTMTEGEVRQLYESSSHEVYFQEILEYNANCPVIILLVEGIDGNRNANMVCGRVDEMGTVRGDFVLHSARNVMHCSDCELTDKETKLFFTEDEIMNYSHCNEEWLV